MDYHPKHIMVTCIYLACKTEEFNVSMSQFVANVKGDRAKASHIVLNCELLLMQQLKYHLTVHNPFRPIEGFLIDIKVNLNSITTASLQIYCFSPSIRRDVSMLVIQKDFEYILTRSLISYSSPMFVCFSALLR